ncbi:MAG: hypothetical protein HKO92_01600 [Flavobacteriaceae bacterium]|nr:hypothetical protein [Flavobacteriaceae bacterium]
MNSESKVQGKTAAIISYFWLFGVIIAFFMNNDKKHTFVSFHIRQSLGLWITYMIIGYLQGFFDSFMISVSFWIFFGVLFLYGIFTAISGKAIPVPLIGNFYQKLFANLGR